MVRLLKKEMQRKMELNSFKHEKMKKIHRLLRVCLCVCFTELLLPKTPLTPT